MSSIQIYKLLSDTVGKLNSQAVALMNGQIEKEEAKAQAVTALTSALAALQGEPAATSSASTPPLVAAQ